MGVRIGGRLGPVSVGTYLSGRGMGGFFGIVVFVSILAVGFIVAVTIGPIVAVGWGIRSLFQRPTSSSRVLLASLAIVVGVGGALIIWPYEYNFVKYYEHVPDADGIATSVDEARRKLNSAGFTNIEVRTTGESGGKNLCHVERQQPEDPKKADTRKRVILFEECRPPAR